MNNATTNTTTNISDSVKLIPGVDIPSDKAITEFKPIDLTMTGNYFRGLRYAGPRIDIRDEETKLFSKLNQEGYNKISDWATRNGFTNIFVLNSAKTKEWNTTEPYYSGCATTNEKIITNIQIEIKAFVYTLGPKKS
ncbi:MAG: hypothetical protein ACP5N1_04305 [Candidatus Woesearchaeota archaeon]